MLQDILSDALSQPWSAEQEAVLGNDEGMESVVDAVGRVNSLPRVSRGHMSGCKLVAHVCLCIDLHVEAGFLQVCVCVKSLPYHGPMLHLSAYLPCSCAYAGQWANNVNSKSLWQPCTQWPRLQDSS